LSQWRKSKDCRREELGDVSSRTENSGGQFWKRLRSTKDCHRRRRRGGGGGRRRKEEEMSVTLVFITEEGD
jgi:hypothetical protein